MTDGDSAIAVQADAVYDLPVTFKFKALAKAAMIRRNFFSRTAPNSGENMSVILISGLTVMALFMFGIWLMTKLGLTHIETPEKRAGRLGESIATDIIREILRDDDVLFVNIPLHIDHLQTELDNVIVNRYGVHIIEVKTLNGMLIGDEDEDDWIQTQNPAGGYFLQKTIKNPIRQVKRQVDILSQILKKHGLHVRIKGYVFFVEMNSPIKSRYVLETQGDIDAAIHRESGERDNIGR